MSGSYSKRNAKGSKQPREAGLSDRELLRSAKQSADAHARNQSKQARIDAAEAENKRAEYDLWQRFTQP